MNLTKGLVSVIMTNYNTPEEYLRQAIESILGQTYSNFEFIIVDDGSTDNSLEVITSYADSRIKVLKNEQNLGITKSLNKGLSCANGEYIARMDADDISDAERFARQVEFLSKNSNVIVCGTWSKLFGELEEYEYSNNKVCREIPSKEEYRIMLLFGNYPNIIHSSAMFNHRLMLEKQIRYDEAFVYAQDYRMWVECSKYFECSIIPELLHNLRVRSGSISTAKKTTQEECVEGIIQMQLDELGLVLQDVMKTMHIGLLNKRVPYDQACLKWMKQIMVANKGCDIYKQKLLEVVLWKKWCEIVYFSLRNCNNSEKFSRIKTIPVKYMPELVRIWMKRKMKKK